MMIVKFWAKGYADSTGLSSMSFPEGTTEAVAMIAIRKEHSWAKFYAMTSDTPRVVENISPEYARMMSQHDNS